LTQLYRNVLFAIGLTPGRNGLHVRELAVGENNNEVELAARICALEWWERWKFKKEDVFGQSAVLVRFGVSENTAVYTSHVKLYILDIKTRKN